MTTRETLQELVSQLPEDKVKQVLDFARYVDWLQAEEDCRDWSRFAPGEWDEHFSDDDIEYTEADIKKSNPLNR